MSHDSRIPPSPAAPRCWRLDLKLRGLGLPGGDPAAPVPQVLKIPAAPFVEMHASFLQWLHSSCPTRNRAADCITDGRQPPVVWAGAVGLVLSRYPLRSCSDIRCLVGEVAVFFPSVGLPFSYFGWSAMVLVMMVVYSLSSMPGRWEAPSPTIDLHYAPDDLLVRRAPSNSAWFSRYRPLRPSMISVFFVSAGWVPLQLIDALEPVDGDACSSFFNLLLCHLHSSSVQTTWKTSAADRHK